MKGLKSPFISSEVYGSVQNNIAIIKKYKTMEEV
jgi:hypothetical protein